MVVPFTAADTHHILTAFDSAKSSQNEEKENTQEAVHPFLQPLQNICDV